MAWIKTDTYGGEGGNSSAYWINSDTGEMSFEDPSLRPAASGQYAYGGTFQGDSGGGVDYKWTDTGSGSQASNAQVAQQLDAKFMGVWNNPGASSWDKVKAAEERYGIHAVEQAAQQGMFSDLGQDLPAYIRWRTDKIADRGFQINGNELGLWPVALGTAAFAGLAGAAGAESAAGGSSTGGGAAAPAGVTYGTAAGDAATIYGTGAATGGGSAGIAATGTAASASATPGAASGATGAETGALSAGGGAATGSTVGGAGFGTSLMSNPQVLGALGGAALGAMSGSGSKSNTIQTEEGIPDWLMPYVKPALDRYSTDVQNFQTDPYGIMPSAMQQFQKTIQGDFLSPDSNPYLNDYFRLGAERIKGSLSPTFGHMQAFGQHSGYNEALARGLGDFGVQLYGGAYDKERERQNQLTAAAPAFLGQNSQAQFQPFSQYLTSVGSLGKSKETPYFTNPWSSILGGAMVGSQFGKAF